MKIFEFSGAYFKPLSRIVPTASAVRRRLNLRVRRLTAPVPLTSLPIP